MSGVEAMAPASTMDRPKRNDPLILRAAAEKLSVICAAWDGSDAAEWVACLIQCGTNWYDGYELAKILDDRFYVRANAELVDALGSAGGILDDEHETAVKKWVQIIGFTPAFAIEDAVFYRNRPGLIRGVELETARYIFVPNDDAERFAGGGGWLANAELVTSCPVPE